MNPDTMDMISRETLLQFACSSQFSHTRQQIEILKDKSLAFGVSDNNLVRCITKQTNVYILKPITTLTQHPLANFFKH